MLSRINAYVLAADPTWIELSVRAFYPYVAKIVVSYDAKSRGWTGAPIPVDECLERLRSIDVAEKMIFVAGDFSAPVIDPMENDTRQRNAALQIASIDADWVLQLDTDEWLPDAAALPEIIREAESLGAVGIEWPMRVLYRRLSCGRALEVCAPDGGDHFEYIAPILVRAGSRLVHSRRLEGRTLRVMVRGDRKSLQIKRDLASGELRRELLDSTQAIVHNSWAREPSELRRKLSSWSHSGWRVWWHYFSCWIPSVYLWRWQKNLHPLFGELWPALRHSKALPASFIRTNQCVVGATEDPITISDR